MTTLELPEDPAMPVEPATGVDPPAALVPPAPELVPPAPGEVPAWFIAPPTEVVPLELLLLHALAMPNTESTPINHFNCAIFRVS